MGQICGHAALVTVQNSGGNTTAHSSLEQHSFVGGWCAGQLTSPQMAQKDCQWLSQVDSACFATPHLIISAKTSGGVRNHPSDQLMFSTLLACLVSQFLRSVRALHALPKLPISHCRMLFLTAKSDYELQILGNSPHPAWTELFCHESPRQGTPH